MTGTPGPWPFLDLGDEVRANQASFPKHASNPFDHQLPDQPPEDSGPTVPTNICDHSDPEKCNSCWTGYPQSLFPNWTLSQQKRSLISQTIERSSDCTILYVDVAENGRFSVSGPLVVTDAKKVAHWNYTVREPVSWIFRCWAHGIAHVLKAANRHEIEGLVLGQPFGTCFTNGWDQVGVEGISFVPWANSTVERYNVEPFFWSSSLGWIPSRYQESVVPGVGDRQYRVCLCPKAPLISYTDITIVLKFMRTMQHDMQSPFSIMLEQKYRIQAGQSIDVHAPLFLRSSQCYSLLRPSNSHVKYYQQGIRSFSLIYWPCTLSDLPHPTL